MLHAGDLGWYPPGLTHWPVSRSYMPPREGARVVSRQRPGPLAMTRGRACPPPAWQEEGLQQKVLGHPHLHVCQGFRNPTL